MTTDQIFELLSRTIHKRLPEPVTKRAALAPAPAPAAAAPAKPAYQYQQAEMEDDGESYVPVGLRGVLASTEKLLAINRGVAEPDDRDHYVYKRLHTPDQFLKDRIRLDASKLRRSLLNSAARSRTLRGTHPFMFDQYSEGLIVGNPLSMPLEEINPIHLVEQARRTTQMGPGGIGDESQITDDARSVNPSQFGFFSSLEGPEGTKIGIDARLAWGAKFGSDGRVYQRVFDRALGKFRWVNPEDLMGKTLKLPE